jgi:hypothetical protein
MTLTSIRNSPVGNADHHQVSDCDSEASHNTDFNLDFLESIEKKLEEKPLNIKQQKDAITFQSRATLKNISKKQAEGKTLKTKSSAISKPVKAKVPSPMLAKKAAIAVKNHNSK